jgi:hypothetical protein
MKKTTPNSNTLHSSPIEPFVKFVYEHRKTDGMEVGAF